MSDRTWPEDLGDGPKVSIRCPDCGPVAAEPDAWDGDEPVSGVCPGCGERLNFDSEDDHADDEEGECEDCGATICPEDDYWPFWCFNCAAGPSDWVRRHGRLP